MNRGKTALKRGVAVASVAAMAIAGAVLAAPAASAAVASPGGIRATPTADAAWVDANGALTTSGVTGQAYNLTSAAAGTAKVLTGTNQTANGIQVALVSGQGTANWSATSLKISLANATWNTTPTVTVSPLSQIVDAGGVDFVAGFTGTHASLPTPINAANSALTVSGSSITNSGADLTIPVAADPAKATGAGQGYLLTLSNVRVNVTGNQSSAITANATMATTLPLNATTTIGYAGAQTISVPASASVATGTDPLAFPTVTVTETAPKAFTSGTVTLNLSDNGTPGSTVNFDVAASTPTVVVTGSTATAVAAVTATTLTVTITGQSDTALESLAISGLKVKTVNANATKVALMLAGSGPVSGTNTPAGAFSFTPGYAGLSASVPVTRPDRIAGANRYATAAAIAADFKAGIVLPKVLNSVILANGLNSKNGADALSANFLSGATNSPILLTDSSGSLPTETQAALTSLFKNSTGGVTVYVMGKTDSVSQAARDQAVVLLYSTITSGAVKVVEVSGSNRYATSAQAASQPGANINAYALTTGASALKTVFLASGTTNADALAAGSLSFFADIPVLLTNGTVLDPAVKTAISNLGIQQVIVLGATDRVSAALVSSLSALGVTNTYRIAGANRYATAAALYTFAYGTPTATVSALNESFGAGADGYLANGDLGWPDALTVGPLAGQSASPVLTTSAAVLAPEAGTFLKANKASLGQIWAVGGVDRVPASVLAAAEAAIS